MHVERKPPPDWLRLPLEAALDLTYRCNHDCRHCWLQLPAGSPRRIEELTTDEIRRIADESRALGCRRWAISGGEPMLRQDFSEIFAYLTDRSTGYSLNTNGTLITPAIARLMVRKGRKMVALYGATADVHDHVTRAPGSHEATLRGMAYLREAGAGFIVQIVPMRDNWHQYQDMVKLARTLGPDHRVGAAWLCMSAARSPARNADIAQQRLTPGEVAQIDPPDMLSTGEPESACRGCVAQDDALFNACILKRNQFHIDPYGGMSFCSQIRDPVLRFDLRRGTVRQGWEDFLPGLAGRIRGGAAYREGCATCGLRSDCRWCGAYGYLEHGEAGRKVDYLCDLAREAGEWRKNWQQHHRRYFEIAGVTVQVDCDLPIEVGTFAPKFQPFLVDGPGEDTIRIHHHFGLPNLDEPALGKPLYRRAPWAIHRLGAGWLYLSIPSDGDEPELFQVAQFTEDHRRGDIFNPRDEIFRRGGLGSLTMFPTDQILLARVLADRQACFVHSSAVVIDQAGLLFVGHSEAGKSTTSKMLAAHGQILCDDRNIVRRWPEGFRVHGTWSHGEVSQVSAASAPLGAVLLLKQAPENRLIRIDDPKRARNALLGCVVKPLVDQGWWEKTLDLVHRLAAEVPCYEMHFDRSGAIVPALLELARASRRPDELLEARGARS